MMGSDQKKKRLLYLGVGIAPLGTVGVSLVISFIPYSSPTGFVLSLAIDISGISDV